MTALAQAMMIGRTNFMTTSVSCHYSGKTHRGSTITISGNTVMMATATTSRPKNGIDALATMLESLPLIACNT
jgi:hypothetical protein